MLIINKTMASATGEVEPTGGQLQDYTIDQLAGAFALALGAVGTLLLVVWQSRCLCKCRLGLNEKCELFYCERQPPDDEETAKLKEQQKKKKDAKKKKTDVPQPEPEPEPEVEEVVEELVPENP